MTIKKLLKKNLKQFSDTVEIVDLPNHIHFTLKIIQLLYIDKTDKYLKNLLKRKIDKIFKDNDGVILEIQVW